MSDASDAMTINNGAVAGPEKLASCVLARHPEQDLVLGASRRGEPDEWSLPGGKRDAGESARDCAFREFNEETGEALLGELSLLHEGMDEGGYHTSVYVPGEADRTRLSRMFTTQPREVEPGIFIAYIPPAKLFEGPFGGFNRDVFSRLPGND